MDSEYVSVDRAAGMLGVGKRAGRVMAARGELERREGNAGRPVGSLAPVERALPRREDRGPPRAADRFSRRVRRGERFERESNS